MAAGTFLFESTQNRDTLCATTNQFPMQFPTFYSSVLFTRQKTHLTAIQEEGHSHSGCLRPWLLFAAEYGALVVEKQSQATYLEACIKISKCLAETFFVS